MRKPKAARAAKKQLRLFIDPASISSGFAVYKGKDCIDHGTISVDKKLSVFVRLRALSTLYLSTFDGCSFHEIHIEQLPRGCHHYTHWSVGVIGTALQATSESIAGDIPVRAWQKATDWRQIEKDWKEKGFTSEDAMAAFCMGRFWVDKYL